ncbi:hypothetical protein HS041_03580 [Planomonospora sp. ID67723]|uniref:hypothetical protein n=1 Tax=Planomonospora sp. ID67723 TaxID=2738134 RepID=UPI0018C3ABFD|nr:hypothetical protein [Planomonospora sp. ID67723]MBG0826854.1 hypothetical protein [Planomonospora sp. ID67723]
MTAPSRKPSRATVITAGVAIGVFGAGAGLGTVISANSGPAQVETVRLAAGTYLLNAETRTWTAAQGGNDTLLSGAGEGSAVRAASGDPRVCLSLTTGGQAVDAGGAGCLALPSIGGGLTALSPGNPSADPVKPTKKPSDPPKPSASNPPRKTSDPPKPPPSNPPRKPPAQPAPVRPPATKKSAPTPDPKLTQKVTGNLEGSEVSVHAPKIAVIEQPSRSAEPPRTTANPSPRTSARGSAPPTAGGPGPQSSPGGSAAPATPVRTPSAGARIAPPSVETLRPALPPRNAPATSPGPRTPGPDDSAQSPPSARSSGPQQPETGGTDAEPQTSPSSSTGDSVHGDPSLPVFQDPELLRRAYEALGLDRNMRYTDANGVWDLNIAPPGTPPCRNYTAAELRSLRSAQDGTALPEGVIPRDSCQWPAFIRWLFADPAPGEVSNWTKFTGLPERDLELVVTDFPAARPSPEPSGPDARPDQEQDQPETDQPGLHQPEADQPGLHRPGPDRPGVYRPDHAGTDGHDTGRSSPGGHDTDRPDSGEMPPYSGEYTGP